VPPALQLFLVALSIMFNSYILTPKIWIKMKLLGFY